MAKLPPVDLNAIWIRDLLHRGRRDEARARLQTVIASGKAGPETRALADYLDSAKRGRQPFGASHLWYEIGIANDELRDAGVTYAERLAQLGVNYIMAERQVETAIAKFEAAMEIIRTENSGL